MSIGGSLSRSVGGAGGAGGTRPGFSCGAGSARGLAGSGRDLSWRPSRGFGGAGRWCGGARRWELRGSIRRTGSRDGGLGGLERGPWGRAGGGSWGARGSEGAWLLRGKLWKEPGGHITQEELPRNHPPPNHSPSKSQPQSLARVPPASTPSPDPSRRCPHVPAAQDCSRVTWVPAAAPATPRAPTLRQHGARWGGTTAAEGSTNTSGPDSQLDTPSQCPRSLSPHQGDPVPSSVPVTAPSTRSGQGLAGSPEGPALPHTCRVTSGDSQLLPAHALAAGAHTPPKAWPHARHPEEKGETRTPQRGSPGGDRRAPKERAQERSRRGMGGRGENSRQGGTAASGIHGGPRHSSGRRGGSRCWR